MLTGFLGWCTNSVSYWRLGLVLSCTARGTDTTYLTRLVQAQEAGVGGLVTEQVLAGSLAQLLRRRRHVEDVIDHL